MFNCKLITVTENLFLSPVFGLPTPCPMPYAQRPLLLVTGLKD